MKVTTAPLEGVLIIEPRVFPDERGFFYESFQAKRYQELGIPLFVQDNCSRSKQNVLRGLHFQQPHAQGKLVSVSYGCVWDVVVDIRRSSPTFAQWFGIYLDDIEHKQLYIPPGFAHGFCVISHQADFHYKCTDYYHPASEQGIAWDDPVLQISWPIEKPIIHAKDSAYSVLNEIPAHALFA